MEICCKVKYNFPKKQISNGKYLFMNVQIFKAIYKSKDFIFFVHYSY